MLTVIVPPVESFNNETQQFVMSEGATLRLEHSLVSISKWESKYKKPFISEDTKSSDETLDYFQMMNLDPEPIPEEIIASIPNDEVKKITAYIEDKMTATFFADDNLPQRPGIHKPIVTAEVIYYWMVALQIPVEFETWHLNRLITVIKVVNKKQEEAQKGGKAKTAFTRDELANRKALNEKRRAEAEAAARAASQV